MNFPQLTQRAALAVAVLVASLAALTACGSDSPEKLIASAKTNIEKREYNAAIIQLKNVLKSAPDNGEARLLIGQAYLGERDPESAEKELKRALELGQPHEKALPPFVTALLWRGKYDAVISEVEKHNLFDLAAVAATRTSLGDAYAVKGNLQRARDAYETALRAVPSYPRARLGEAALASAEGRLDEALKQADDVIAADPKLSEARQLRANILLAKGDRPGAKKALADAVAADGSFMPARLSEIRLLIEDREYDAAAKRLNEARKIAPHDLRLPYYGAALALAKGDVDSARQQVQQVLKHLPDHVPSLVLAGSIEFRSERWVLAEDYLSRALARAPGNLGARRMLAATELQMGEPGRARETLRPVVEKGMPQDPQLLLIAGETYLANGDVGRANSFFQAASKAPEETGLAAKTRLGEIALATGRPDEGFKELESVSSIDAGRYQADLTIFTEYLRRNEIDKAMAAVQAFEKKQPKNPLTFQMYGIAHLARKDLAAARRNFEKALELQPNYLPAAYNLAMLDIAEKRPEDARKRYEAMIAKDEKNDQLYLALAELQARSGANVKDTEKTLQRAISANQQSVPARLALIEFYLGNRDARAALSAAQAAVAALPNDPRILNAAGNAQAVAGEVNQAIDTYRKLASLQPRSPEPLLILAGLHARLKETDKAVEVLRRVQKIAPEMNVVPQLVQVYLAAGRPDDALREARDLQQRQPKLAIAHGLEGEIRVTQNRLADAEQAYRTALKLEPNADLIAIRLHEVLSADKKTAEADALAKKWLTDNPKNTTMRLYLGERELAAKHLKAAAGYYQAVIGIDPNNTLALNNLASIGGELGDPKALEHAERAMKLAPNSVDVLDTYAMLLVRKGDAAKALPYLERARTLGPNRNDVRLDYARALIKANRKADARKELEALSNVKEAFVGKDEIEGLLKSL